MSYNTNIAELLRVIGLDPKRHLPAEGLPPREIFTEVGGSWDRKHGRRNLPRCESVEIWVAPLRMPNPRRWKRSTHRLMARCACGQVLSAGRLYQHVCHKRGRHA
jgi:hypothetical protein